MIYIILTLAVICVRMDLISVSRSDADTTMVIIAIVRKCTKCAHRITERHSTFKDYINISITYKFAISCITYSY